MPTKEEKLEKLKRLNSREMQAVYWFCQDESDDEIMTRLGIEELKTLGNVRTSLNHQLELDNISNKQKQPEIYLEYCPVLRELVPDEAALMRWVRPRVPRRPKDKRQKVTETEEATETPGETEAQGEESVLEQNQSNSSESEQEGGEVSEKASILDPQKELERRHIELQQRQEANFRILRWVIIGFFVLIALWTAGTVTNNVIENLPTRTPSPTPTVPSKTPTNTLTPTITFTPSVTQTPSLTPTITNTSPPTSTVTPTNTVAPVLFRETFDNPDPLWLSPVYGDVPVFPNGTLKFLSKTKYILGDESWTNYTVAIKMKDVSCGQSLTIGVRYNPASAEMVAFRWLHHQLDHCEPEWRFGVEDQWESLLWNMFPVPEPDSDGWRNLTVFVRGNSFSTNHGGEITISNAPASGGVVIISEHLVFIDNLVISPLP